MSGDKTVADNLTFEQITNLCFSKANEALSSGEVPVGCVMVYENKKGETYHVLGRNRSNELKNATRHAEVECIDQLVEYFKLKEIDFKSIETWSKVSVYVTVEPCIMCCRAIRLLGIQEIFFGCSNVRFGGCGSVFDLSKDTSIKSPELKLHPSSLDPDRAIKLLQAFYEGENPNAPPSKVKKKKKV